MFFQHIRDMPSTSLDDDTHVFSTNSTNRPVIEDGVASTVHKRGASKGTFTERLKYRRTPFISDTFSSPLRPPTEHHYKRGRDSPSTSSSAYSQGLIQSPPRAVPFALTDEQLQGTPIAEQVRLLTENTMQSVGLQSPEGEREDGLDMFLKESREVEAYEFSDGIGQGKRERISLLSSIGSSSTTTENSSRTSIIPAQFNLIHFPEQFRTPPASIKLIKVYDLFNARPGVLLTVKDILNLVNDQDYDEMIVSSLIHVLRRKKYIKQVGEREAWVIRR